MKSLYQDKQIEISYLSSGKMDKLDKSDTILQQTCSLRAVLLPCLP